MVFDVFQGFLPEQLHVFGSHEAALGGDGVDESLFFQLVVGALGGDDADAQILGEIPDGGQGFVLLKLAADDLGFDLGVDLVVNGKATLVVDQYGHFGTSLLLQLYMCSIYRYNRFVK